MAGWHLRFNGHELEQTQGESREQVGPECCSPWGHKESDTAQRLSDNNDRGNTIKHANPSSGITHRIIVIKDGRLLSKKSARGN